jgi:hypothetical protein
MLFRSDRTTDFLFRCLARFQDREASIDVIMRLWNHVSSNNLTDLSAGGSSSINGSAHGSNVTSHDRGYQSGVNLFPADEAHVRSFDHCVCCFDHRYQTHAFNHAECFCHFFFAAPYAAG